MPCDSVQTMTVTLKNADKTILRRTLEALSKQDNRFRGAYVNEGGTITLYGRQSSSTTAAITAQVKRAYSIEVVKMAATMGQWELSTAMTNEQGNVTMQAMRIGQTDTSTSGGGGPMSGGTM